MESSSRVLILSFFLSFLPFLSLASGIPAVEHKPSNYWFLQIGAGGGWQIKPNNSYIRVAPENPEPYQSDLYHPERTATAWLATAGFGYAFLTGFKEVSRISLSADYTFGDLNQTRGVIYEFGLPQFKDYEYSYKIKRNTFMADLKINMSNVGENTISPYVLAGAGASINHTGCYSERAFPNIKMPKTSLAFSSDTKTYFSWQAGAGLDWDISKNWGLSLGYLYTDLGKARLGAGNLIPGLKGPQQKVRLNDILLSLVYKF